MSNQDRSILVAEDNTALATVVRFNLERAGFQVTVAANGRIAWEAAQAGQFDLVVTDYQMPEMTGRDLAVCLRGCERCRDTPINGHKVESTPSTMPRTVEPAGRLAPTSASPRSVSPAEPKLISGPDALWLR